MELTEDQLNRVRIALALLPWPAGVRTAQEAVQRLQDAFPLKDGGDAAQWRKRAEQLRIKLAAIQQDRDILRLNLLLLTQKISTGPQGPQGEKRPAEVEPSDVPSRKKKKKTQTILAATTMEETAKQLSRLELTLESTGDHTIDRPGEPSSQSFELLAILRGIQILVSEEEPDVELLRRSLELCLQRIHLLLSQLLQYHAAETISTALPDGIPPPASHVALVTTIAGMISSIGDHFITYFPDECGAFIGLISDDILSLAIRSIVPLTRGLLARSFLLSREDIVNLVDIRPALLHLIVHLLCTGEESMKNATGQQVMSESVKELASVFLHRHASDTSSVLLRRKWRQERLARKDALPYLCSILRTALSSNRTSLLDSDSPRAVCLAYSAFRQLSKLHGQLCAVDLHIVDGCFQASRSELGVLAEGTLLAVIEYAWMCRPEEKQDEEALYGAATE